MIFHILVQGEGRNCLWLQAKMKVATVLVWAACMRCPWLQEETKEATILGMFKAFFISMFSLSSSHIQALLQPYNWSTQQNVSSDWLQNVQYNDNEPAHGSLRLLYIRKACNYHASRQGPLLKCSVTDQQGGNLYHSWTSLSFSWTTV